MTYWPRAGLSFNHLVRAAKERKREGEAERLSGLHVDDQLDPGGLLNRQVGRLSAFENPADILADDDIHATAAIAHEAAGFDGSAILVYRRHSIASRQCDKLICPGADDIINGRQKCAG